MQCCACQEAEATVFRECSHNFCSVCIQYFTKECRESYCKDAGQLQVNSDATLQNIDLIEKSIQVVECNAIKTLADIERQSALELERLLSDHKQKYDKLFQVQRQIIQKNVEHRVSDFKKLFHLQSTNEAIKQVETNPLAIETVQRYKTQARKIYALSELERLESVEYKNYRSSLVKVEVKKMEVSRSSAFGFFGFVSFRSGETKTVLKVKCKLVTELDNLKKCTVKVVDNLKVRRQFSCMAIKGTKHAVGFGLLRSRQHLENKLILTIDTSTNEVVIGLVKEEPNKALKDLGFTTTEELVGDSIIYHTKTAPPIYFINDIANAKCELTTPICNVPHPDCYLIEIFKDGKFVAAKLPR